MDNELKAGRKLKPGRAITMKLGPDVQSILADYGLQCGMDRTAAVEDIVRRVGSLWPLPVRAGYERPKLDTALTRCPCGAVDLDVPLLSQHWRRGHFDSLLTIPLGIG